MRKAAVFMKDHQAGWLTQDEHGYHFAYDPSWISRPDATPVSLTLPLRNTPYSSNVLFPFFDGLIPEGWLLEIVANNWKLNPRDRMGLLLVCCRDCIGAVSIRPVNEGEVP